MTTTTTPTAPVEVDWYRLSAEEVRERLEVNPAVGLSTAAVMDRRARDGTTELADEAKEPGWRAFLRQYHDVMQLVVVSAAVVSIVARNSTTTSCGASRGRFPPRGEIGIFNRSPYEEVVALRVHPELLDNLQLPPGDHGPDFRAARYEDLNALERHFDRNATKIVKFVLHVSKAEQKHRFMARLDNPNKL